MEEKSKPSPYEVLSKINVNHIIKGKGKFKYISWSDSVDILLKNYPESCWSNREWNGVPVLKMEKGCFVEVSVIIKENNKAIATRSQLHPVLDHYNKPILAPTSFELNTSLQRALSKTIALHGLGLYIYRGEDLPDVDIEATDEARGVLRNLLKEKGKSGGAVELALANMSLEQINGKIDEYSK